MTRDRYALPAILDMGNSTIRVLVADVLSDGSLIVVGIGEEPSAGMEEGKIVDLERVTECLRRAVRTAEIDSGRKLHEVHVAVSGEYIRSYAVEGKTVIHDGKPASQGEEALYHVEGGVVGERDLHKVREMAVAQIEILMKKRVPPTSLKIDRRFPSVYPTHTGAEYRRLIFHLAQKTCTKSTKLDM